MSRENDHLACVRLLQKLGACYIGRGCKIQQDRLAVQVINSLYLEALHAMRSNIRTINTGHLFIDLNCQIVGRDIVNTIQVRLELR